MNVDLAIVARDLKLPPGNVETTVRLLDEGNTIPFITRFRKDLTGALNEKQILAIKQQVTSLRALAERKAFILKSIESQGKLTDELRSFVQRTNSSRRLEDIYLPFKPKKQTRAATAKQQGLEPLANDIFSADSPDVDLATRATHFVRVDKGLNSVEDVIRGVADLLVERFGENGELRHALRQVMWNTGKLESCTTGDNTNTKNDENADETIAATVKNELPEKTVAAKTVSASQTMVEQKSPEIEAEAKADSTAETPADSVGSDREAMIPETINSEESANESCVAENTLAAESEPASNDSPTSAGTPDESSVASATSKPATATTLPKKKKKRKKRNPLWILLLTFMNFNSR